MIKHTLTIIKEKEEDELQQPLIEQEQQYIDQAQYCPPEIEIQDNDNEQNIQDNNSIIVGGGMSGMDIGSTFGFQRNKTTKRLTINQRITKIFGTPIEVNNDEDADQLYDQIPKYIAWGILFYAAINNAMMPPWIMTIKAEKYLRISWRFLLQGIFLIPFVMYEFRTGNEKVKKAYTFEYITQWHHMRKLYLASLATTITFGVMLFCFDYTNISSVFVLTTQSNFWLSVRRDKKNNHDIENAGKTMCMVGFLLIVLDSYLLTADSVPDIAKNFINPLLYNREPWQRMLIGNCIPFGAALFLAELSKVNVDLRQIFPPYLNSMIVSFFVCLNMSMVSYFMDGTMINFDSRWGWFGLFHNGKFMGFFYMSTMLSIGVFISSIFISKLFEPIIPATSSLFEPVITSILCRVAGVQYFPGAIACFGYVFLLPGQFIIILGQHMYKKEQEALKDKKS